MITQFKKGVLEMCVLALIYQKDRYGYEIVEVISRNIEVTEGTIYPLLRRIVGEGYAKTYLMESGAGPTRKYYRLTEQGRKHYLVQIREWANFVENVKAVTTFPTDLPDRPIRSEAK